MATNLACLLLTTLAARATTAVPALAEAVDSVTNTFCTGGSAAWTRSTTVRHDGVDSAASGVVGNNQSTWMETTVAGPATVTFRWKVSSEEDADELSLKLDGAAVAFLSGEVDWTQRTLQVPAGSHVVRWEYEKDGSLAEGADQGWVDQVVVPSGGPAPVITSASTLPVVLDFPFTYQITGTNAPTSYGAVNLPEGLTLNTATGVISGRLGTVGSTAFTITATNAAGTTPATLTLTVSDTFATIRDALDLPAGTGVSLATPAGGTAWARQTTTTHDGVDAAKMGFGPSGVVGMQVALQGPAIVSYWWKYQPPTDVGSLRFFAPGGVGEQAVYDTRTTALDWQKRSCIIPAGQQILKWQFQFYGPIASASLPINGWVDDVQVQPITYPLLTAGGIGTGFQNAAVGETSYTPTTSPTELRWFGESHCAVTEAGNRTPATTGPDTPGTPGVKSLVISEDAGYAKIYTEPVSTNGWSQVIGSLNFRTFIRSIYNFGSVQTTKVSVESSADNQTWLHLGYAMPPLSPSVLRSYTSTSNTTYTPFASSALTLPAGTNYVRLVIQGDADVAAPVSVANSGFLVFDDLLLRGAGTQVVDLDADGDGYRASQELLFGTSDTDGSRRPAASIQRGTAGSYQITVPSAIGRTYRLFTSTTLASGSWVQVQSVVAVGATTTLAHTPAASPTRRYYRVEAQ